MLLGAALLLAVWSVDCGMALELEPEQLSEMCCTLCTFSDCCVLDVEEGALLGLAAAPVEALELPLDDVPVMATVCPL